MRLYLAATLFALSVFGARAEIVFVNPKATGTPHDGRSWGTAFLTIPQNYTPGTEVWVAAGVYSGRYTFGAGMSYYGGFAGTETSRDQRDWVRNKTVLDAAGTPSCFSTSKGSGRDTAVDGFTIRHVVNHSASPLGAVVCYGATVLRHLTISGLDMWPGASVIYVMKGANPLIQDCVITSNPTDAIWCADGSASEIRGCLLRDNDGIGIYAGNGDLVAVGNLISGGTYGTGIEAYVGTVAIEGNVVQGNADRGVVVYDCTGHVTSNRIIGNAGSGVSVSGDSMLVANNLIADNRSPWSYTGGIFCGGGSPQIVNNTIVGNGGPVGAGGIYVVDENRSLTSKPFVANNLVAFNDAGVVNGYYPASPVLSHNCVFGNGADYVDLADATGKDGNIKADPRLALPDFGNFHIQPDSPCRGAGDVGSAPGWPDIDGQPRVQNGAVDIGADESGGTLWPSSPIVVRVKLGGNDANDGSSWSLAKRTVQGGIDALATAGGGQVFVDGGVYSERIRLGPYTRLRSAVNRFGGLLPHPIIDAGGLGAALTISAGGARTMVDGFEFRNGSAVNGGGISIGAGSSAEIRDVNITNCAASSSDPDVYSHGGGISANSSTLTLKDCAISNCQARIGGGLYARLSSVSASRCAFVNNDAVTENDQVGGGGGIFSSGSAILEQCTFIGNTATGGGGGGSLNSLTGGPSSISRCTFADNSAGVSGGGMIVAFGGQDVRVADSLFARNKAGKTGGGLYLPFGIGRVVGNTFTGNQASFGGGMALVNGRPAIENNILAFNSSGIDGGSEYGWYSDDTYWHGKFNCVFGNAGGDYAGPGHPLDGNGNIHVDPLFANAATGDYRLQSASPCVDAGDLAVALPGETDLDGSPRVRGRSVDIGALESPYTTPTLRWPDAWRALGIAAGLAAANLTDSSIDIDRSGRVDLRDVVAIVRILTR
ncbi:MAG TPA: right-handed parallel beta-helix repeat-containing protein [Armatimonadota bacterium]|jgi:hypothetical protein